MNKKEKLQTLRDLEQPIDTGLNGHEEDFEDGVTSQELREAARGRVKELRKKYGERFSNLPNIEDDEDYNLELNKIDYTLGRIHELEHFFNLEIKEKKK